LAQWAERREDNRADVIGSAMQPGTARPRASARPKLQRQTDGRGGNAGSAVAAYKEK
jgi:hypothetical protein